MVPEVSIDELSTGRSSPIDQHCFSVAGDEGSITLADIQEMSLNIGLGDIQYTRQKAKQQNQ